MTNNNQSQDKEVVLENTQRELIGEWTTREVADDDNSKKAKYKVFVSKPKTEEKLD